MGVPGSIRLLAAQQGGELAGADHGMVRVAVVHQHLDPLGVLRQALDPRDPLLQPQQLPSSPGFLDRGDGDDADLARAREALALLVAW
jgi:hypothetical protein